MVRFSLDQLPSPGVVELRRASLQLSFALVDIAKQRTLMLVAAAFLGDTALSPFTVTLHFAEVGGFLLLPAQPRLSR